MVQSTLVEGGRPAHGFMDQSFSPVRSQNEAVSATRSPSPHASWPDGFPASPGPLPLPPPVPTPEGKTFYPKKRNGTGKILLFFLEKEQERLLDLCRPFSIVLEDCRKHPLFLDGMDKWTIKTKLLGF